jgi:hypothetical protein
MAADATGPSRVASPAVRVAEAPAGTGGAGVGSDPAGRPFGATQDVLGVPESLIV